MERACTISRIDDVAPENDKKRQGDSKGTWLGY